jgi:uncharacterized membrane protein YfhO
VLLDSYAPGWRAEVDQEPTPIYVANHAYRAVVVPAGRHHVTFSYAPPSLPLAIAISTGAGLVVMGLIFWLNYAKRIRERQP